MASLIESTLWTEIFEKPLLCLVDDDSTWLYLLDTWFLYAQLYLEARDPDSRFRLAKHARVSFRVMII